MSRRSPPSTAVSVPPPWWWWPGRAPSRASRHRSGLSGVVWHPWVQPTNTKRTHARSSCTPDDLQVRNGAPVTICTSRCTTTADISGRLTHRPVSRDESTDKSGRFTHEDRRSLRSRVAEADITVETAPADASRVPEADASSETKRPAPMDRGSPSRLDEQRRSQRRRRVAGSMAPGRRGAARHDAC